MWRNTIKVVYRSQTMALDLDTQWLEQAVEQAHQALMTCPEARDELEGRGVSVAQMRHYRLGYTASCPLWVEGTPEAFCDWAKTGRFDQAVLFPLTNAVGQVLGLQVRSIDRAKKQYSDFFVDRSEAVTFGLTQACNSTALWDTGECTLVEGPYDLLALQRHDPAIVATLTVDVDPLLWRLLCRLAKRLWIVYDNDKAGRAGAYRVRSEAQASNIEARILTVPAARSVQFEKKAKDPSDLWELWGDQQVARWLRESKGVL